MEVAKEWVAAKKNLLGQRHRRRDHRIGCFTVAVDVRHQSWILHRGSDIRRSDKRRRYHRSDLVRCFNHY